MRGTRRALHITVTVIRVRLYLRQGSIVWRLARRLQLLLCVLHVLRLVLLRLLLRRSAVTGTGTRGAAHSTIRTVVTHIPIAVGDGADLLTLLGAAARGVLLRLHQAG